MSERESFIVAYLHLTGAMDTPEARDYAGQVYDCLQEPVDRRTFAESLDQIFSRVLEQRP